MSEKKKSAKSTKNLKTVKERIKYLRLKEGYSFGDVAKKLGKSKGYRTLVYQWENPNRSNPSFGSVAKLAELYGVTIDWIMFGDKE